MRTSLQLLLLLAAAAPSRAQERDGSRVEFDTSRPPRGIVRDEQGEVIGGADVSFRVGRISTETHYWRDRVLRTQPLPRVRSGRDGEFFLPLTLLHRLLSTRTGGKLHLVVRKRGFHPWIEPLRNGLRGYLGSEVVLRRITPADARKVVVRDPKPGMLLRVFRTGAVGMDPDNRFLPVPADGVVTTTMQFVPSPAVVSSGSNYSVPVGVSVQLLYPGRSTAVIPLPFGQQELRIPAKATNTRFVCTLREKADPKVRPAAPRGLYLCPDRRARWFPVDADNVVESARLTLLALDAKDRLAVNIRYVDPEEEVIRLTPIRDVATRGLLVQDAAGGKVTGAAAYFFDLEHLPAHGSGSRIGPVRARRRLRVVDGRVNMDGVRLPGPGFVYIEAPGFKPIYHFEPRAIVGDAVANVGRRTATGRIALTVTDDKKAVPDVYVVLAGSSAELGALPRRLPRTDARGRVTIDHVRAGNHSIQLVGRGVTEYSTMVRVQARKEVAVPVSLFVATPYRIQIVDGDDAPAPFRQVRCYATFLNNNRGRARRQMNTNSILSADSAGRILIADFPAGAMVRVLDPLSGQLRGQQNQLTENGEVQSVSVTGLDTVLMPLPRAKPLRESMQTAGRTSNRTLIASAECSAMLVRFPGGNTDATLSIYLQGAPPIRLTRDILARARQKQGKGLLVVDQRVAARKVRFDVRALPGEEWRDLRIEIPGMNFLNGQPYLYGNSGLRLTKRGEHVEMGLRDDGEFVAKVMHPKYLLADIEIPAQGDGDPVPLPLRLERGVEVVFLLRSTRRLDLSSRFNLYVHSQTNQMVLYQRELLSESNLRKVKGDTWELRLPFALPPDRYYFSVRVYNTRLNLARRMFQVPDQKQFVIEVNGRNATVPEPIKADLGGLRDRVKRLRASTEALRKMVKGAGKKAKGQLQRTLEQMESRLEAHEKELQKLENEERVREARRKAQEAAEEAARKKHKGRRQDRVEVLPTRVKRRR